MSNTTTSIAPRPTAIKSPLHQLPPEIRYQIFEDVLDSNTVGRVEPLFIALEGKGNEELLAEARYVHRLTLTSDNVKTFESTRNPSLKSYLREITLVLPLELKRTPLLLINNLEVVSLDLCTHFNNTWWLDYKSNEQYIWVPAFGGEDKIEGLLGASRSSKLYPTDTLRKFVLRVSGEHENYLYKKNRNSDPKTLQKDWIEPFTIYFGFLPRRTENAAEKSVCFTWEVESGNALVSHEQDRAYKERQRIFRELGAP